MITRINQGKCQNGIFFLVLFICFASCKKGNDSKTYNTELKATVVLPTGSTININATGAKAKMGCSFWGGGNYLEGTNDDNAAVYITYVQHNNTCCSCVTGPGTYNFSCEYRKNVSDPNTPIYSNNGINRGSITFTVFNDHYMEGFFNAVSRCNSGGCAFGTDSVIITGTFKGDY